MIPECSQQTLLLVQVKVNIYSYTQQNVFIHINTRKGASRCPSSNLLVDVRREKSGSPFCGIFKTLNKQRSLKNRDGGLTVLHLKLSYAVTVTKRLSTSTPGAFVVSKDMLDQWKTENLKIQNSKRKHRERS